MAGGMAYYAACLTTGIKNTNSQTLNALYSFQFAPKWVPTITWSSSPASPITPTSSFTAQINPSGATGIKNVTAGTNVYVVGPASGSAPACTGTKLGTGYYNVTTTPALNPTGVHSPRQAQTYGHRTRGSPIACQQAPPASRMQTAHRWTALRRGHSTRSTRWHFWFATLLLRRNYDFIGNPADLAHF